MKDASKRYHDRVARRYDAIYDDPYWRFHDELTWRMVRPHLPGRAGAACCDLGCGTGKWGLKLLKSGFAVTFVDHSAAMVEQVRSKLAEMGRGKDRTQLEVGDIVSMPMLSDESFELILAIGDPLSICSDAQQAANEMYRICCNGGVVIATADNKLAALEHYVQRGNLDELEDFVKSGRTNWLTADERERFELTTFTPASLRKLFERSGFEVLEVVGKPIIPVRNNRKLLEAEDGVGRLLKLEKELARDPASAASAGHLQVVAKKPAAHF